MDDPQTPDPAVENPESTTPPAVEAPEDNVEDKVRALENKISEQSMHLSGSKAEALRLKQETDTLKAELATLKAKPPAQEIQVADSDVELFKQYAKKAGVATKDEIEAIRHQNYKVAQDKQVADFLEKYPEYKPENDSMNTKWGLLLSELAQYKAPANPEEWGKLLNKAHKIIAPDNTLEKGKALGMAQAKLGEQAQLGGGSASTQKKKLSPEQQAIREGFKTARPEYFKD